MADKIKMMATWVELALVFQIQTGVRLAPESLDLKSQETVFRSIIKRIWSRSKFKIAGITQASKNVWGPVSSSPSCRPLIDHSRSGIGRRPIVCNEIWTMVAEITTAALGAGNCRETFGVAWKVAIRPNAYAAWKPTVLKEFNAEVAKRASGQTTKDAKPTRAAKDRAISAILAPHEEQMDERRGLKTPRSLFGQAG